MRSPLRPPRAPDRRSRSSPLSAIEIEIDPHRAIANLGSKPGQTDRARVDPGAGLRVEAIFVSPTNELPPLEPSFAERDAEVRTAIEERADAIAVSEQHESSAGE